ncbi:hypothetical protein AGDE_00626 [Angomonas deanei]|nr:hypothetical protein AGDE_00626 [Angomonas deanei]|eukprot:EPY43296.1 hypothetical protein AGDE_00626 [Angomonas deanei]
MIRRQWSMVSRGAIHRHTTTSQRSLFYPTRAVLGLEQLQDVPASTDRKPSGLHRGPGKRQTSAKETEKYQFIKKWDLQMQDAWDDHEAFKGLPKPKVQFGNEATEMVWPYALLLERVVKVHPFTKSIYVYYSQRQMTPDGARAAKAAQAFSREFLIPITFHNAQVYVETEMLLEYSETPWVVLHCMDGRQEILPVRVGDKDATPKEAATALLDEMVKTCERLGASVEHPKEMTQLLNERPLQNQYLRINYQWFGDTPEERMSHLVQWDFDPAAVEPKMRQRTRHVLDRINYDGNLPTHQSVIANAHREASRIRSPKTTAGPKTFFNSAGSRANARHARFGDNK